MRTGKDARKSLEGYEDHLSNHSETPEYTMKLVILV
jgi:hypothetical protein